MSNDTVHIEFKVEIARKDLQRIRKFAEAHPQGNEHLLELSQGLAAMVENNLKGILGQIAQIEAQTNARFGVNVDIPGSGLVLPDG